MNTIQLQKILKKGNHYIKLPKDDGYGLVFVPIGLSLYECRSHSGETYTIDVINRTCNCKGFYYGKSRTKKGKKICKHLIALGCVK